MSTTTDTHLKGNNFLMIKKPAYRLYIKIITIKFSFNFNDSKKTKQTYLFVNAILLKEFFFIDFANFCYYYDLTGGGGGGGK